MHSVANKHEKCKTLGHQFGKHVVHIIPYDNPLRPCFAWMSENELHMFEAVYYLVKKGKLYSDFPELIILERMHGMKVLSSHGHRNACKQFIHFIT